MSGLPKVVRFSASRWDRFTADRKQAEIKLAQMRGQQIEIMSKK